MQVKEEETGRIDQYLFDRIDYSRSKIKSSILKGEILVNGNIVKANYKVKENDDISIDIKVEAMEALPEDMNLDIVYEDDDLLVVNKANGVVVHPAVGNKNHTLVNGLLYHSKNLSNVNGDFRPGIVHRIDAYTTGLLVVAKNNRVHEKLADELKAKKTKRVYYALVWGEVNSDTGTIDAPIGRSKKDRKKMAVVSENSKDAVTNFTVIKRYDEVTLLELVLETGRTHQIRVHMEYIGYPIVNDPVYGRRKIFDKTGQCLHAKKIGFTHPKTGEYMEFDSELPECFTNILANFKKQSE